MPGILLGIENIGGKKRQTCHCTHRGHDLVGETVIKQTTKRKITGNVSCVIKNSAVIKNNSRSEGRGGNLPYTVQGKPFQSDI